MGTYPELIRTLAQLSDYYKDYMQREERSFDNDEKLLGLLQGVASCEALDLTMLEEMSILWTDDLPPS